MCSVCRKRERVSAIFGGKKVWWGSTHRLIMMLHQINVFRKILLLQDLLAVEESALILFTVYRVPQKMLAKNFCHAL